MSLSGVVARWNRNKFFRFISSVRLAVPTMLFLCFLVGWGTVLESLYNAEYASLVVYKSWWFSAILVVLWMNIFCATLSRYPFKKHHLGFVITHIGLLTLLAGGLVTSQYGIDGQLQVMEGGSNSTVLLSRLMIGYQAEGTPSIQKIAFERSLRSRDGKSLDFINNEIGTWFKVNQYLPFAKVEKSYEATAGGSPETSLSFMLKSQFFNVTEWLHTRDEPEKQMGPATLRLVKGEYLHEKRKRAPKRTLSAKEESAESVAVLDAKTGKEIQNIPLSRLQSEPLTIRGVEIILSRKLRNAIVAANKLEEGGPAEYNPALEFEVKNKGEVKREVLYAKYGDFSLHPEGVFGLRLSYSGKTTARRGEPVEAEAVRTGGAVVEFHISDRDPKKVQVVLIKNDEVIQENWVGPGESVQTPWMGMKIFIGSLLRGSESAIVARPLELEKKSDLPPSAVELQIDSSTPSVWMSEGDEKEVVVGDKRLHVFYGRETLHLPFEIALKKFSKIDYPGTETPLSYESVVQINGRGPASKISMNEPLKIEGYTIYQASYSLPPSGPPISVFSVNRDPGRFWKYIGSLILAVGVVIYTFMKSRWSRAQKKGG